MQRQGADNKQLGSCLPVTSCLMVLAASWQRFRGRWWALSDLGFFGKSDMKSRMAAFQNLAGHAKVPSCCMDSTGYNRGQSNVTLSAFSNEAA